MKDILTVLPLGDEGKRQMRRYNIKWERKNKS
jgi:hypothetical protein